jgi:hypothetical protein
LPRRRRITLADILAATGYEQRDLWELRPRGLFPFLPEQTRIAGRRGSASSYTIEARDYLQQLAEVQRKSPRNADDWLWSMWLAPADWPVDMRAWVLAHLDRMLDKTKRAKASGKAHKAGPVRPSTGAGRVRSQQSRQAAWGWIRAWAFAAERPDLYSATPQGVKGPSFLDLLLRVIGAPFEGLQVPRAKGRRERISERGGLYLLAHYRRIVALAPDRYIEGARRDWRVISHLIETAERVDWNKVPDLTAVNAKPPPPSWAARKARRVRPKSAPDFIRNLTKEWRRRSSSLALLFATLLTARLLLRASMPQLLDAMLGMAQQWLEGLPQIEPEPGEK